MTNGLAYTVNPNANSKSVEIVDDDTAPHSVSLSAPVSVVEGDDILVKLEASPALTTSETLNVDFQVANVTGTYLNYTLSSNYHNRVPIHPALTISIPTRDDYNARSVNGEIKFDNCAW